MITVPSLTNVYSFNFYLTESISVLYLTTDGLQHPSPLSFFEELLIPQNEMSLSLNNFDLFPPSTCWSTCMIHGGLTSEILPNKIQYTESGVIQKIYFIFI